jgi:hypothetical protein
MYLKLYGTIGVPLLELIARNIARYPQFVTSTPIYYHVVNLLPTRYTLFSTLLKPPPSASTRTNESTPRDADVPCPCSLQLVSASMIAGAQIIRAGLLVPRRRLGFGSVIFVRVARQ